MFGFQNQSNRVILSIFFDNMSLNNVSMGDVATEDRVKVKMGLNVTGNIWDNVSTQLDKM